MREHCCVGVGSVVSKLENPNQDYKIDIFHASLEHREERIIKMTEQALAASLKDAGIEISKVSGQRRVGLVIGTSLGNMENLEKYIREHLSKDESECYKPNDLIMGSVINHIRKKLNFKGQSYLLSNTCVSGLNAIEMGVGLIENNSVDVCLVGSVDIVSEYISRGLSGLKIISKTNKMMPFGLKRNGMTLTEGAGFLVLSAKKYKKNYPFVYGKVKGCVIENDISERPLYTDGGVVIKEIINEVMRRSSLDFKEIDCIFSSANGTKMNDRIQASAISECCRYYRYNVPVSSMKTVFGHTLGAAGVIECISIFQCMKNGCIPALNNYEIDETLDKINLIESREKKIHLGNSILLAYGIHRVNGALLIGRE